MGILLLIAFVLVVLAIVGGLTLTPWLWLIIVAAVLVLLLGAAGDRT